MKDFKDFLQPMTREAKIDVIKRKLQENNVNGTEEEVEAYLQGFNDAKLEVIFAQLLCTLTETKPKPFFLIGIPWNFKIKLADLNKKLESIYPAYYSLSYLHTGSEFTFRLLNITDIEEVEFEEFKEFVLHQIERL